MARFLAIDWDVVEMRFVAGVVLKDRLVISSVGSASIEAESSGEASAEAPDSSIEDVDHDEDEISDEGDDAEVVETVEKSYVPRVPVADDDEEEDESDPTVVSTVTKKSGESFKNSPLALAIKRTIREHKVGGSILCYSVERNDVDVKYVTIPNAGEMEIPELIFNEVTLKSLNFNETQPLDFCQLGLPEAAKRKGTRRYAAVTIARDKLRRIRETLAGAYKAPKKIELRDASLTEFLRADFCKLNYEEPVLLIQELADEVNMTLCYEKNPLFFRSFKLPPDSSDEYRAARIHEEFSRTVVAGIDDLPEDAEVNRAVFFTDHTQNDTEEVVDAEDSDQTLPSRLLQLFRKDGIELDFINPFRLPGIQLKQTEPLNAGRYASLVGMLLAERPLSKPMIDLLHPHEKPKPPNYKLLFFAYFLIVGVLAFCGWRYNKKDLERVNGEIEALKAQGQQVQAEYVSAYPQFGVLSSVNSWQNAQGVVVLDELRDIMYRFPSSPDFVVTKLAYMANYPYSSGRGRTQRGPAVIIRAKVTSQEVFKLFWDRMRAYNGHQVITKGTEPNEGGGAYKYMFDAVVLCQRRPAAAYANILPQEIKTIFNNQPEYYVQQEEERRKELQEKLDQASDRLRKSIEAAQETIKKGVAGVVVETEGAETPTDKAESNQEAKVSLDQEKAFQGSLVQHRNEVEALYRELATLANQGGFDANELQRLRSQAEAVARELEAAYKASTTRVNQSAVERAQAELIAKYDDLLARVVKVVDAEPSTIDALVEEWSTQSQPKAESAVKEESSETVSETAKGDATSETTPSETSAEETPSSESTPSESTTAEATSDATPEQTMKYANFLQSVVYQALTRGYQALQADFRNRRLSQEQANALDQRFKETEQKITQRWKSINEGIREKQGEAGASSDPTPEQDAALLQQLLQMRARVDSEFARIQQAFNQGAIPVERLNAAKADYAKNVAQLEATWREVQERVAKRSQNANVDGAPESNAQTTTEPAPATPAPAPAAEPAPETPAPAPAAEPAPENGTPK